MCWVIFDEVFVHSCFLEVSKVDIDMEKQRVYVTSDLPSDKLLEIIKKTGKATNYIGTA